MRIGKPIHALGGGARKDHLFEGKQSLCDKYMWGGGREIDLDEADLDEEEVCKKCLRKAGVISA